MAAGRYHTLLVDRKGELYACGTGGSVLGQNPAVSNLQRPASIPLPAAATRIVQISANFNHAAFVTESGQVIKKKKRKKEKKKERIKTSKLNTGHGSKERSRTRAGTIRGILNGRWIEG